jgi:hypothetical protein
MAHAEQAAKVKQVMMQVVQREMFISMMDEERDEVLN